MSDEPSFIEDKTPSPLAFDSRISERAPCEERLKACEVMLMLNQTNTDQVKQHKLAYDEALKDIQQLRARIKALENEIANIRQDGAHNVHAMEEYLQLTETLDFKVESKRLYSLVMNFTHFYLRFDRNGQIAKALSPEEYNSVIKGEWDNINKP
jgi:exonuclease VII large subunit